MRQWRKRQARQLTNWIRPFCTALRSGQAFVLVLVPAALQALQSAQQYQKGEKEGEKGDASL